VAALRETQWKKHDPTVGKPDKLCYNFAMTLEKQFPTKELSKTSENS
jgi:hypothetical protein